MDLDFSGGKKKFCACLPRRSAIAAGREHLAAPGYDVAAAASASRIRASQ